MRTSPFLVMYFRDGELICENYITRRSFRASPATCELMLVLQNCKTFQQTLRALPEYTSRSVYDSVKNLLDQGLLITLGSEQDRLASGFGKEWLWPIASRYYHFSTKIDEPFATSEESRKFFERYLKGKRQPSIYKTYSGSKIKLPPPSGPDASLFATMRTRTTTRSFSGASISLKQLSRIVYYTWGKISAYNTVEFGHLLHKASPSAGARHPIEAYVVINSVKGIKQGIYHYSVKDHSLELLRLGDFRDKCVEFSAGQSWTRNASAFFMMTSVVARTAWKYRIPRVYRAFLLDVGHLSQSFLLISTALGLGAFCIGIISDATIERELGIDGINETALFAVGVGQPAPPGIAAVNPKGKTSRRETE